MEERYTQLWTKIKYYLEQTVGEKFFYEVFENINDVEKVESNTMYLLVNNNFTKNRIDRLFLNKINSYLEEITTEAIRVKFVTKEDLEQQLFDEEQNVAINSFETPRTGNLNGIYTFRNFVTGKNNRFASTVALQVADQPGVFANPMYIFGSVGIGKTHLMQSIGNYILDNSPETKVLYVKTESFVEDYVRLVQSKNMDSFDEKYNNIDVLLVDDIQFLEKKEQSQQQFFKLFERLHSENKQIVITSDRPATELKNIMTRLTSRFSWGLVVDIDPPDLSHRMEILKKKLKTHIIGDQEFPEEILEFIAKSFTDSVRELEGALNRVIMYSTLMDGELSLETTKLALGPLLKNKEMSNKLDSSSNADKLIDIVSGYFSISKDSLLGTSRKKQFVYPRQVAMYLMRTEYELQYKKIGQFFGGKDHSTVMNAFNKINIEYKRDESVRKDVENIKVKVDNL